MKNLLTTKLALLLTPLGIFLLSATAGPGNQTQNDNYHVKIVSTVNGKTQVQEKDFATEAEMNAFMKEQQLELPAIPEPPVPPTPPQVNLPDVPAPPKPDLKGAKKVVIVTSDKKDKGREVVTINIEGDEDELAETNTDSNKLTKVVIVNKQVSKHKTSEDVNVAVNTTGNETGEAKPGGEKDEPQKDVTIATTTPENTNAPQATATTLPGIKGAKEENIHNLTFFPNPSNGRFYVSFTVSKPADVELRITDLNGKEVYSDKRTNFSGQYEKNFYEGKLATGSYIMNVISNGEQQSLKMTIAK